MDATELLKQQHDEIRDLFAELEQSGGNEQENLFLEIADALAAHTKIEEEFFYPSIYTGDSDEARAEHTEAKRMLADMMASLGKAHFGEKAQLLLQTLEKHLAVEENEFERIRSEYDAQELERVGAQMEKKYDELIAEQPSQEIPTELEGHPASH